MALYVLGEGRIAVRCVRDYISNVYRVIVGKHDFPPGKLGDVVREDAVPLHQAAIFETRSKDQALNIACAFLPEGRERFMKALE